MNYLEKFNLLLTINELWNRFLNQIFVEKEHIILSECLGAFFSSLEARSLTLRLEHHRNLYTY